MTHTTATLTSKCQITVPKFVRQTLGVDAGSTLTFILHDGAVVISRAEGKQHHDPAVKAFLGMLEQDIRQGRHVGGLPADLFEAMHTTANAYPSPDQEIEGEVCL